MRKVIIAIMVLITLIIVGISVIFLKFPKVDNVNETNQEIIQQQLAEEKIVKFDIVTNTAMYFTVESSINTYINYIENKDGVAIYKVLDSTYIEENNIKEENVLEYIATIPENSNFDVQKMLIVNGEGEDLQKYYVYGILRNNNGQEVNKHNMYLTVNIDLNNMTFSIIPNVPDEEVFNEQ